MRLGLLLAFILLTGGFLGSSAHISGEGIFAPSQAQFMAMGESAAVIAALLLPGLIVAGVLTARGLGQFFGWRASLGGMSSAITLALLFVGGLGMLFGSLPNS